MITKRGSESSDNDAARPPYTLSQGTAILCCLGRTKAPARGAEQLPREVVGFIVVLDEAQLANLNGVAKVVQA